MPTSFGSKNKYSDFRKKKKKQKNKCWQHEIPKKNPLISVFKPNYSGRTKMPKQNHPRTTKVGAKAGLYKAIYGQKCNEFLGANER